MKNLAHRAWLFAACAAAAVGCTGGDPETQVLTGRIQTSGALAVRAVTGDTVITAATVRSDGSFTLSLPVGERYRLEVLTTSGVRHVVASKNGSLTALTFAVCDPLAPYDIGGIGPNDGTAGGMGGGQPCDPMDPDCKPTPCGPNDPMCEPPPPPCADPMDPACWPCQPGDPTCVPPPMCDANDPMCQPPTCGPNDPMCQPPTCDPSDPMCEPPPPCLPGDPNCPPPPTCDPSDPMCDPCASGSTDPNCWSCQPGDPSCEPPPPPACMDPTDPYCWCDANGDCPPPTCAPGDLMCPPPPPPPCADPMDPDTCQDPCVTDPSQCGCSSMDPNCWPPPQPPDCTISSNGTTGMCEPGGGWMTPEHPPTDFGCMEPGSP